MPTIEANLNELRPGQPLTGTVLLQFEYPVTISHLTLSLVGTSFSRYVSGEWVSRVFNSLVALEWGLYIAQILANPTQAPTMKIDSTREPDIYQEKHIIINKAWKIFDQTQAYGGTDGLHVKAGEIIEVPFNIDIPLESNCSTGENRINSVLPPTFERTTRFHRTKDATVDYTFRVAVHKFQSTHIPFEKEFRITMSSPLLTDDFPEIKALSSKIKLTKHYKSLSRGISAIRRKKGLKLNLELVMLTPTTLSKSTGMSPQVYLFCKQPPSIFQNKTSYETHLTVDPEKLEESVSEEELDNSKELSLVLYDRTIVDCVVDLDLDMGESPVDHDEFFIDDEEIQLEPPAYDSLDPLIFTPNVGKSSFSTGQAPIESTSPETITSSRVSRGSRDSGASTSTVDTSLSSLSLNSDPHDSSLSLIYLKGYAFNLISGTEIRAEAKTNSWGKDPSVSIFKSTKPQAIDLANLKPTADFCQLWMKDYEYPYAIDISDCFRPLEVGAAHLTPSFETCNIKHFHDLAMSVKIGATATHMQVRRSFSKFERVTVVP